MAIILAGLAPALAAAAGPVEVVALRSRAEQFVETLVLRGRTEASRRVEVRAEIAGLVASSPLEAGTAVEAGDALCGLEPGDRPADLAGARAELRRYELDYEAARKLVAKGFTSETETASRAALLEGARANLMRAELAMERLSIEAPFAGVLEADTAERGALLRPGDTCAELIALDPILLVGFVSERDVQRLDEGRGVTARLASGQQVRGEITFIAAESDETTRTYRVEATASNPDHDIRAGMTAEIRAPLPERPAHRVPQSALTLDGEGRLGLRAVEDGRVRFHPVALLSDGPEGAWVSGLPATVDVIVVGQEFVDEGDAVAATLRGAEKAP